LTALGSCLLLAATAAADPPPAPLPTSALTDPEFQALLERLSALSDQIGRNVQSPDVWRHPLGQGGLMLRLGARCQGREREKWLRMAVESYHSAAAGSPAGEQAASQRLRQLPGQLAHAFPGSHAVAYAALRQIQADYAAELNKAGDGGVA